MHNPKKKKIAIVWANPYSKNLGVAALAYSSLALLNDVVEENNLSAEFTFFGSSLSKSDQIAINSKVIQFNNIPGLDFFSWKSIAKIIISPGKYQLQRIYDFEYIFDIAEGDSFTDIYGNERFNRILNTKRFFSLLKKKQLLLPQTIGPFKTQKHEDAAFTTMKRLSSVISRDKQSYDYTLRFLPKERLAETIDVAFYMPFEKASLNNGMINVGINISGLLWNGGYTKNNQFEMMANYKELIRKTLIFFAEQENVQVHLVSHVIGIDYSVENDFYVAEELAREFPKVILSPRFETPIEAKNYISGLDFFTGARMHACIAAFSTGVPVFPMAYSRKFNGLFEETLQYSWMGDCINENDDIIFERLKESFLRREQLQLEIETATRKIIKPRLQLIKDILLKSLTEQL